MPRKLTTRPEAAAPEEEAPPVPVPVPEAPEPAPLGPPPKPKPKRVRRSVEVVPDPEKAVEAAEIVEAEPSERKRQPPPSRPRVPISELRRHASAIARATASDSILQYRRMSKVELEALFPDWTASRLAELTAGDPPPAE